MEVVTQVVDSTLLSGIITLPKRFLNKKVEVVVTLNEEKTDIPKLTISDIDKMMKGTITEALIGIIPQSNTSLSDYRAERLAKYEHSN